MDDESEKKLPDGGGDPMAMDCLHCAVKEFTNQWHDRHFPDQKDDEGYEYGLKSFADVLGELLGQSIVAMTPEQWAAVAIQTLERVRTRAMTVSNQLGSSAKKELPRPTHAGPRRMQ